LYLNNHQGVVSYSDFFQNFAQHGGGVYLNSPLMSVFQVNISVWNENMFSLIFLGLTIFLTLCYSFGDVRETNLERITLNKMVEVFLLKETLKKFHCFIFTPLNLYETMQLNSEEVLSFTTSTQHYKV
jgi:hypothetical protein